MALTSNEREVNLSYAQAEMAKSVANLVEKYGLTTAEAIVALSSIQSRWAGYQLRDERDSKS